MRNSFLIGAPPIMMTFQGRRRVACGNCWTTFPSVCLHDMPNSSRVTLQFFHLSGRVSDFDFAAELVNVMFVITELNVAYKVRYIRTENNIAHGPSRQNSDGNESFDGGESARWRQGPAFVELSFFFSF